VLTQTVIFDFAAIFVTGEPIFRSHIGHIARKIGEAWGEKSGESELERLC
jgi:hypothetical protein